MSMRLHVFFFTSVFLDASAGCARNTISNVAPCWPLSSALPEKRIQQILGDGDIQVVGAAEDPIEFNLREHLGQAMKTLAARAHQKGLELAYFVPPELPEFFDQPLTGHGSQVFVHQFLRRPHDLLASCQTLRISRTRLAPP